MRACRGRGEGSGVYPRGVVEAQEVDEGVQGARLLDGLAVAPLHAHPP